MGEAGKRKLSRREGRWLEERGVGSEKRTRGRKEDYKISYWNVAEEKIEKRVEEVEEGGGDGKRYKEKKREYRKICERKKTEENKKWMRKAQEARTEGQVWGILRLEKRKGRNWAWKE